MNKLSLSIFVVLCTFASNGFTQQSCFKKNQSISMCKGYGYCTSFPLGKEGGTCGQKWKIPKSWFATSLDCFSNLEKAGNYSCQKSGKIKITICGKSNCYQCICD